MWVNINHFKNPGGIRCNSESTQRVRRKLRGIGGAITAPTPETNDSLKNRLKIKMSNGDISIGEMIVPKKI